LFTEELPFHNDLCHEQLPSSSVHPPFCIANT
jgi:hypothetical protein